MTTIQEIVDDAAMELGIIESGNSLTASQSADAMAILNRMMDTWKYSDMDLHFFEQDTLTDVAPLPLWAEEGVISNLAIKMSVPFNVPVSLELVAKAKQGSDFIARTLINAKLEKLDMTHLARGTAKDHNILTDS